MRLLRKVQFSVRSILVAIAAIAILTATGVKVRYHFFQLPFHPSISFGSQTEVTKAVESLNSQLSTYAVPENLKLTDWEVIDAVRGQRELAVTNVRDANRFSLLCDGITMNRLLPAGSKIDMSRCGTVTLAIPIDATSGYAFIVRHPGLKLSTAGDYSMDFSWKPNPDENYIWTGDNWQVSQKD
jgi:hypothetical protein